MTFIVPIYPDHLITVDFCFYLSNLISICLEFIDNENDCWLLPRNIFVKLGPCSSSGRSYRNLRQNSKTNRRF